MCGATEARPGKLLRQQGPKEAAVDGGGEGERGVYLPRGDGEDQINIRKEG